MLAAGDRAVRAERDDDQLRQVVLVAQLADQAEALGPLAAAARVGAVALVGEVRQRQQHRRVADRDRRPAEVDVLARLLLLDPAAGGVGRGRAQRQQRESHVN